MATVVVRRRQAVEADLLSNVAVVVDACISTREVPYG